MIHNNTAKVDKSREVSDFCDLLLFYTVLGCCHFKIPNACILFLWIRFLSQLFTFT